MSTKSGVSGTRIRKVLVTGGRAPAALELVRALAKAGCEVIAAESLPRHLCRKSSSVKRCYRVPSPAVDPSGFIDALEEIIVSEHIDLLVPTCEETFYAASGYEKLSRLCEVFTVTLPQLRVLHSKWSFIQTVKELGFLAPATIRLNSEADWETFLDNQGHEEAERGIFGDRVILKPEYSRFAAKIRILDTGKMKRTATPQPDPQDYPWIVQQYIEGRQICTYSIVREGRLYAHATYTSQYAVQGGASVYFEPLDHPASLEWVKSFVWRIAFTGQIAFDFIETADGRLYPIECNPRTTSGVHLLADQPGFAEAVLSLDGWEGEVLQPSPHAKKMLSLPMLLYGLSGRAALREIPRWLQKWVTTKDAVFHWKDLRPFVEQLPMLIHMRQVASKLGISLVEASTVDLEWNGDEI
ncbi:ATP-grasp domain-containing protein [Paenibacillus hexagrammi]|uniref:ATP-grasp domain-containing protein n=1 Tax=Paenibacillus hexagrammi TaxID=2908839 RepID=A0ABY3SP07_9BACL|nr:ATP-grasp domain-containing protein [Paenibacillus sp. YPD9-1]UJF34974.1 ATP-grasp domain-containing protein [Paenibacillus sp. YPD9-1]